MFWFEENYYLGKEVTYASAIRMMLLESFFAHNILRKKGEYDILNTIVNGEPPFSNYPTHYKKWRTFFRDCLSLEKYLYRLDNFYQYLLYARLYHNQHITSGIALCGLATALGYKKVFIAGIDLYQAKHQNTSYAFKADTPTLRYGKNVDFSPKLWEGHSLEFDIETLNFLMKHYGVEFYSICPTTPINKYIPLAPTQKTPLKITIEPKPKNFLNGLPIPDRLSYDKLKEVSITPQNFIYTNPYEKSLNGGVAYHKSKLKQNLIFMLCKDLFRLPNDIKHYIKGCLLKRKNNKGFSNE